MLYLIIFIIKNIDSSKSMTMIKKQPFLICRVVRGIVLSDGAKKEEIITLSVVIEESL